MYQGMFQMKVVAPNDVYILWQVQIFCMIHFERLSSIEAFC
jgi:hypothetical protein